MHEPAYQMNHTFCEMKATESEWEKAWKKALRREKKIEYGFKY